MLGRRGRTRGARQQEAEVARGRRNVPTRSAGSVFSRCGTAGDRACSAKRKGARGTKPHRSAGRKVRVEAQNEFMQASLTHSEDTDELDAGNQAP